MVNPWLNNVTINISLLRGGDKALIGLKNILHKRLKYILYHREYLVFETN